MRIEDLFKIEETVVENVNVAVESFTVEASGMTFSDNCYQTSISNDIVSEFIENGNVMIQVFDANGTEVLSGSDIMAVVDTVNKIITIKSVERPSINLIVKVVGLKNIEEGGDEPEPQPQKLYQKFFIIEDDMIEDSDGVGWSFTINQDDLEKIDLSLGNIEIKLFNNAGIDITSSPLFQITAGSESIIIHNIASKPEDTVYVAFVIAEQ